MDGINAVHISGNLGADPELRSVGSGTALCRLRVAVNTTKKINDEWRDHTEWVSVVVWGKLGEIVAKTLRKGAGVTVAGELRTRTWDKDGQKRYSTEVIANQIVFSRGPTTGGGRDPDERPRSIAAEEPLDGDEDGPEDDLPF